MNILHSRMQHSVGQGSFHSATLEVLTDGTTTQRFDYVYDCGTHSGGKEAILKNCIKRLDVTQRSGSEVPVIDALVLSHYDQDHINGAKFLAEKFDVKRIFLPYLSPEDLAFVIASRCDELTTDAIIQLHRIANGGSALFGVPVVMVAKGQRPGDDVNRATPPNPNKEPSGEIRPPISDVSAIRSIQLILSDTGAEVGNLLHDDQELLLFTKADELNLSFWMLRFWNRGLDKNLKTTIKNKLVLIGFPVDSLSSPTEASTVLEWLAVSENKNKLLNAYRQALSTFNPKWISESAGKKLANLLSIGLYSGPSDLELENSARIKRTSYKRFAPNENPNDRAWWFRHFYHSEYPNHQSGWLGTGDAPLGEPEIWKDFASHYKKELSNTLTVLIPHHGSASRSGPKSYNSKLNHQAGVISVISFGKFNSYGHPRASVLKSILAASGDIQLITEEDAPGLLEVLQFES